MTYKLKLHFLEYLHSIQKSRFRNNLRNASLLRKNNYASMQAHPHINVFLDCRQGLHFIIHFFLLYPFLHSFCRACFMGSFIPCNRDGTLSSIPALLPNSVNFHFWVTCEISQLDGLSSLRSRTIFVYAEMEIFFSAIIDLKIWRDQQTYQQNPGRIPMKKFSVKLQVIIYSFKSKSLAGYFSWIFLHFRNTY